MHVLPVVHRLEEKYPNELVVIGVHAGKFIAERETDNIRIATRRLGVHHPVVNDRQFRTWRAFGVQAWPTVVLVGPDGSYLFQHSGEFGFDEFDSVVQRVLTVYDAEGLVDRTPLNFPIDPEPEVDSPLRFPAKVLADPAGGRIFVADTGHNRVLVCSLEGDTTSVTATIGSDEAGLRDGSFSEAALNHPHGMAVVDNTLYICDTENHALRAADLDAGTVTTIAGMGEIGYSRKGGHGPETELNSPWDVLESDNYLYVAMAGMHQIWRMYLSTGVIEPFVGSGGENIDDGPNPRATLAQPSGLTTDEQRLFFADSESSAVRASDFSPEGSTQTLVGQGLFEFGDRDGRGPNVRLQHCLGVAYYNDAIYIADTYNNKIKRLDLATNEVTTVLGSGDAAELYEPGGVSIVEHGGSGAGATLYIADTNNHRILRAEIDDEGNVSLPTRLDLRFA